MQDHTLVGVFDSPKSARAAMRKLEALFRAHAKEVNGEGAWKMSQALPFSQFLNRRDFPELTARGRTVVAHCFYGAGFGDTTSFIAARGGIAFELDRAPTIAVRFELPKAARGDRIVGSLVRFLDQARTNPDMLDWAPPPWAPGKWPLFRARRRDRRRLAYREDGVRAPAAVGARRRHPPRSVAHEARCHEDRPRVSRRPDDDREQPPAHSSHMT